MKARTYFWYTLELANAFLPAVLEVFCPGQNLAGASWQGPHLAQCTAKISHACARFRPLAAQKSHRKIAVTTVAARGLATIPLQKSQVSSLRRPQKKSLAASDFCFALRAQRLKKFKILKFSSEIENFKRAAHQTPIFCGEFWRSGLKISSEIEIFKREWKFQSRLIFFDLWALRVGLASKSQENRSDHGRKSPQPRDVAAAATTGH